LDPKFSTNPSFSPLSFRYVKSCFACTLLKAPVGYHRVIVEFIIRVDQVREDIIYTNRALRCCY
jgi:hypothetical protein